MEGIRVLQSLCSTSTTAWFLHSSASSRDCDAYVPYACFFLLLRDLVCFPRIFFAKHQNIWAVTVALCISEAYFQLRNPIRIWVNSV